MGAKLSNGIQNGELDNIFVKLGSGSKFNELEFISLARSLDQNFERGLSTSTEPSFAP